MRHDLVVLGDMVADLIVPIDRLPILPNRHGWADGIFVEPGGAANVVVAARRLNLSTGVLAALGTDQYGQQVLDMLAAEGADVSNIARTGSTVLCIVLTDKQGQHVYLGIKEAAQPEPFLDAWHEVIHTSLALFTNGYTLLDFPGYEGVFAAFETARKAGVPIYFDIGPSVETIPRELAQRVLAGTDTLMLTEEEADFLCVERSREAVAQGLLKYGPSTVVLKLGAEGCIVATPEQTIAHPGFQVEVADTVGAGDAFAAAFIAGCLRGGSLRDAAALANAMGAITVTQRGAGTRIPPRERLLELLESDPAVRALV